MDLSSWPSPLVDFNVYKSETVRQYAPPGIMQLGSTCHYLWSFLAKIMNRMNQTFKSKNFLNPRIWEIDEQSKWYHRKQPSRSRMYKIPKTVPKNELISSTIEWHEKRRALLPDLKKKTWGTSTKFDTWALFGPRLNKVQKDILETGENVDMHWVLNDF